MKKIFDLKGIFRHKTGRGRNSSDKIAIKKHYALPDSEIATRATIQSLLISIDKGRVIDPIENDYSGLHSRIGFTFPSPDGPLTVLCETDTELFYYQGGLAFLISVRGFDRMMNEIRSLGLFSLAYSRTRRLSSMEVEFILGILSSLEPTVYWSVVGDDLVEFSTKSRKNLNEWTVKIASLLLAQKMLKRYARTLYQKISMILVDGVWSRLSESVSSDDASLARFTGYLLGSYESQELMNKVINARSSIFYHILQIVESMLDICPTAECGPERMADQVEMLCGSFAHMGVHVKQRDVQSYIREIDSHPNEIRRSMQILRSAFDQTTPR